MIKTDLCVVAGELFVYIGPNVSDVINGTNLHVCPHINTFSTSQTVHSMSVVSCHESTQDLKT